jgi:uncharacterized Fe-S cluster-containing radical SAM superfamily protein
MSMPPYAVLCYTKGCGQKAVYKIAARWSDGLTSELKTYALSCAACLPEWFRTSRAKQAACRLAPGEVLELPGVYHLARKQHDQQLRRVEDVEQQLLSSPTS